MSHRIWKRGLEKMDLSFIGKNLQEVRKRMNNCAMLPIRRENGFPDPRLVAVSKMKSKEYIIEAYQHSQRHFGENYVQELVEKATDPDIVKDCPDIKWHFIGHLQKNKVSKLLSVVDKLFVVETIDSQSLAESLANTLQRKGLPMPLNVMVQINTSGEKSKSGVSMDQAVPLVKYIVQDCPQLKFLGLMCIGTPPDETKTHNHDDDFKKMHIAREMLVTELGLNRTEIELSMGMSNDFETAINQYSSNVRVGSTIFGARQKTVGTSID